MNRLPPAIFLMGPTAAGKTETAIRLVQDRNCEIISVDSAMVYRGMDIGTAKPDTETLALAPHRLIDICDPAESYSAAQFREDALRHMAEITAAGRVPLLVGGTMLYFKALEEGLSPLPSADEATREQLRAEEASEGLASMHARLAKVDPQAAARIHPNDPQRIHRALEVFDLTGRSMSDWQQQQQGEGLSYALVKIALAPPERADLHRRIEQRFRLMLEQGLVEEVRKLFHRDDLHEQLPAIRSVGYRQVWHYLQGQYDESTLIEKGIVATRQLAKRQMTWLRSYPDIIWQDSQDPGMYANLLKFIDN